MTTFTQLDAADGAAFERDGYRVGKITEEDKYGPLPD